MTGFKRIIAILLASLLLILPLAGCSSFGEPVMELGGTEITANMIEFWLSRYKAQFIYYYGDAVCAQYGLKDIEKFWSIKSDTDSDKSFDDVMSEFIYENAKTYLCSLYLFEQFGLSLPKETEKEIDDYMQELMDGYA